MLGCVQVVVSAGDRFHSRPERQRDEVVVPRIARDCRRIDNVGVPLTELAHLTLERGPGAGLEDGKVPLTGAKRRDTPMQGIVSGEFPSTMAAASAESDMARVRGRTSVVS